jgi:hypothetical protein
LFMCRSGRWRRPLPFHLLADPRSSAAGRAGRSGGASRTIALKAASRASSVCPPAAHGMPLGYASGVGLFVEMADRLRPWNRRPTRPQGLVRPAPWPWMMRASGLPRDCHPPAIPPSRAVAIALVLAGRVCTGLPSPWIPVICNGRSPCKPFVTL